MCNCTKSIRTNGKEASGTIESDIKSNFPVGQHREAASDRLSPNLRSAYCSLLGGRAIVHLITLVKGLLNAAEGLHSSGRTRVIVHYTMEFSIRANTHVFHYTAHCTGTLTNSVDPACYSAFRRGTVISAVLSWLPMSSDCAFIPEGRSVSSRYTFPLVGAWLGVICRN